VRRNGPMSRPGMAGKRRQGRLPRIAGGWQRCWRGERRVRRVRGWRQRAGGVGVPTGAQRRAACGACGGCRGERGRGALGLACKPWVGLGQGSWLEMWNVEARMGCWHIAGDCATRVARLGALIGSDRRTPVSEQSSVSPSPPSSFHYPFPFLGAPRASRTCQRPLAARLQRRPPRRHGFREGAAGRAMERERAARAVHKGRRPLGGAAQWRRGLEEGRPSRRQAASRRIRLLGHKRQGLV
jgi:hypothetical protein